ncbi:MAG TPA: chemotaxis protein CheB [Candidatus Sulfotelmatobacter sp.]|nr:chemotaxis protein CheB [Candidatus Sulfotelmatobacter sp.]
MKKTKRRKTGSKKPKANRILPESTHQGGAFPIVGIGASAGGFEAFTDMLKHLPADTGMAFVFVQHLDPTHSSVLAEILSRTTKIPVVEVSDGMKVIPNRIHVIPANTTMQLRDGELHLGARILVRGQHLLIDEFFQSLAKERGNQAIGVILSGTASDGTEGCRAIKAEGGITFAQDEGSARFSSMPRSAALAGCVDFVLPPQKIAQELRRIGRHPYLSERKGKAEKPPSLAMEGSELNELLSLVREASGVDFGLYKQTTLQRRIRRRIVVHRMDNIKAYLRYVRQNPAELDELYRDILIHVTGFFRDKEAYKALSTRVFPALFHNRSLEENPIRIWIPGCSTGEEAYSIAITLFEFLWEKARTSAPGTVSTKAVQIFATDISEAALDRARLGLYTAGAVADVSPQRLSRFFIHLDGGYQISKSLREMCVFARQNVAKDPPFSNLDLITCRNLLIYLGPELQKRVIPTLHYALKPDGYLMLGGSESLGAFSDHFVLIDKKNKIYQKKRTANRLITYFTGTDYSARRSASARSAAPASNTVNIEKEVERVLVNRFVPASIVVNDQMEIVQFRGRTGAYLEPASGHPTFSLSKMAREGLLVDLRAAVNKSRKNNTTTRVERVHVKSNGHSREVDLEVIPVRGQGPADRFYVVVFQDSRKSAGDHSQAAVPEKGTRNRSYIDRENERVKREAAQLRGQLKALIEEHETTSEEFKSANEEVLSANEELQSANEELETAKEELQSSNEELNTLNEELQNRNVELSLANNDLLNLLGNVNIPVVMVGNDLRIRRFTPPAQKLLNLISADIGRRLREIRPNLDLDNLETAVQVTVETNTLQEQEVREKDGAWYLMRVRPYKTTENKIEGAVMSFQDIDQLKRTVNETRDFADALIQNAREALLILDSNLRVSAANPAFYKLFHLSADTVNGFALADLAQRRWIPSGLRDRLQEVLRKNVRIDEFEMDHEFPHLGSRTMLFNAHRFEGATGRQLILLSIEDVTDYNKHQADLRTHSDLLELARDAVLVRDMDGMIQLWNRGAERLYGWTKGEAIGKNVIELLKTEFPAPVSNIHQEILGRGYWEGELIHTRKDGEQRYVESRWSLHREGNTQTILELNSDITDRKRYEEQLQKLSGELLQVRDEERRRIARDLHDSTGQKLVALKMSIEDSKKLTRGQKEQAKLVDEILSEIRTLAQLLHPPLLEEAGLLSASRWLVDGFSERAGIKVNLKLPKDLERLPSKFEIALFRVIQEALNNIHRHSGARSASLEVGTQDGLLLLKISDDGRGMKMPSPNSGGTRLGVGLLGMRERLAQLGGRLTIESGEKGTSIQAEVPLARSSKAS